VPYLEAHGNEYGSFASNYNGYCAPAGQSSSESKSYGSTEVCYIQHSLAVPTQTISFIFAVYYLEMAPGCWRFLPRPPPVYRKPPGLGRQTRRNNFIHINNSAVYRWENGVISHATEYSSTITPGSTPLEEYRAITMFYNRGFVLAEGDASIRDMIKQKYPRDRWFGLRFRHEKSLSRVDLTGDESYMAERPNIQLENSLGLGKYQNQHCSRGQNHGLNGNLAVVLALIAFSCRCEALDKVFMSDRSGWNNYQWKPHKYDPAGRKSQLQPPFLANSY
jgi:hypothetical protein